MLLILFFPFLSDSATNLSESVTQAKGINDQMTAVSVLSHLFNAEQFVFTKLLANLIASTQAELLLTTGVYLKKAINICQLIN